MSINNSQVIRNQNERMYQQHNPLAVCKLINKEHTHKQETLQINLAPCCNAVLPVVLTSLELESLPLPFWFSSQLEKVKENVSTRLILLSQVGARRGSPGATLFGKLPSDKNQMQRCLENWPQ